MRRTRLFVSLTLGLTAGGLPGFQVNPGTPTSVVFPEPALAQPGRLHVDILSDRTTGFDEGLPVLEAAVAEIREDGPDFVMTVGDMINGYTRSEDEWRREFVEEWAQCVEQLGAPLFPSAGNHDTRPGSDNPGDDMGERLYREHFGPLYYSFDIENAHFISLYSDDGLGPEWELHIGEAQLAWLRDDLEATAAEHIFVFLHRPLWMSERGRWDGVHALLAATGRCRAVIAGHNHAYEWFPERDGIQYLVLGATGGTHSAVEFAGGFDHWCRLTIAGSTWQIETKIVGGAWVPPDHILHADAEARRLVERLSNDEAGVQTTLQAPSGLNAREEVVIRLTNPLETAVPVSLELASGRGDGWTMTPTYFRRVLDAHATDEFTAVLTRPGSQDPPPAEPQMNIQYQLTDSRGRAYPVTLRRRLGWQTQVRILAQTRATRTVDARREGLEGWDGAMAISTPTWGWAPWETREPAGDVRISWGGEDRIHIFARLIDADPVDFADNHSEQIRSDALVLRSLDASGEEQAVAIFPYREGPRRALRVLEDQPETAWPVVETVEVAQRRHNATNDASEEFAARYRDVRLWEVSLPVAEWMGGDWQTREPVAVNLEVLDNDGRYFTSTRSWAPRWGTEHWALVGFGPPARPASAE